MPSAFKIIYLKYLRHVHPINHRSRSQRISVIYFLLTSSHLLQFRKNHWQWLENLLTKKIASASTSPSRSILVAFIYCIWPPITSTLFHCVVVIIYSDSALIEINCNKGWGYFQSHCINQNERVCCCATRWRRTLALFLCKINY